jgi:hypothetical protein
MMQKLASVLVLLLATSPAFSAGMRKCKDPASGKIIYTDRQCPTQTEQERLEIHDNRVGSLPAGVVQPFPAHSDAPQQSVRPRKQKAPKQQTPASSTGTSPVYRSHY